MSAVFTLLPTERVQDYLRDWGFLEPGRPKP